MARTSDDGVMVNRIFAAGVRVRQVAPDHELGGFVAIADLDDTPPVLRFLPVVGWALIGEIDRDGSELGGILTVTYDAAGEFELWDPSGAAGEEFLGIYADKDPATVQRVSALASARLKALKERSRAADALLPAAYDPGTRTYVGGPTLADIHDRRRR